LRFEREKRERTGVCELLLVFVRPSVLQANKQRRKEKKRWLWRLLELLLMRVGGVT
jgi:hypothetical protein